jgi:hypothetical protein
VTESGGDVRLVRDLPGVAPELVRALVEAFDALTEKCTDLSGRLEAGAVHEHAFGKLIDATKVCDAYHDRLPATKANLAEAREVAAAFLAEFVAPPVPAQREPREPQVLQESRNPRG